MKSREALLTTSEVAKMLHLHVNTVRRYANNGIIKSYRIGARRDRRFTRQDVSDFLGSNRSGE